jgi:hypothetical protein
MGRAASDPKGHLCSQQRNDNDDNNNTSVAVEPVASILRMWEILGSNLASRIGYSRMSVVFLSFFIQLSRQ